MAETKKNSSRNRQVSTANTSVSILDVFFTTIRHWPWIVLSVAIFVGAAYIYLLRIPDTYTRAADIMIKDDTKGRSIAADYFADIGLLQTRTNINNEVINLKAKDLMEEVVRRLNLDQYYYRQGAFHKIAIYGTTLPVKVSVADFPEEGSYSMNIEVAKDGKVTIRDLSSNGTEYAGKKFIGKFNTPIKTPIGKLTVTPTSSYNKGEKVDIGMLKVPIAAARDSYNARLGVSVSDKESGTNMVRLTMSDQAPERADDVLNTVIGVYNENWVRDRNQVAVSTSNFINDRLGVIESELGNVDSDISSYKSATMVPDIDAAGSMYMQQSQQTQNQIMGVNNQLAMARYIRSYLASDGNHDQLLPTNTGLESANVQGLITQYNNTLLQRNALVAKSSEKNPLVTQMDADLTAQRQAMIRTVDNEIVALNTQLRSLRGTEAQTQSRIASNPAQAKNLLSVERQQKVKESLYLYLLTKREENEISQAFTAYNTKVVNRPGASGIPSVPNRRSILTMAFLIGFFLPFGVTFVKELTNTKVRGRKDVENLTLPFLGEIPMTGDGKKNFRQQAKEDKHEIIIKEGSRDMVNEAFRVLRTNVEFMKGTDGDASQVIAITSFNPHSGKSFIAVNLGMTLALKHRKVIVVDGDLRRRTTSAYVGSPETGLADYLSGSVKDLDSVIVTDSDNPDFSVLPVGTSAPNPTELLETPRFGEMIKKLREDYDFVIIDCPPIEVLADAQIIDRYADRTVFVVRAGLLDRSMLAELDKLYEQKKYHNMSFILNGTVGGRGKYGYGYRYGYGYGYAYGYGYGYGYAYGEDGTKKRIRKRKKKSNS